MTPLNNIAKLIKNWKFEYEAKIKILKQLEALFTSHYKSKNQIGIIN